MNHALALAFSAGFLLSAPFTIVANFLNYIGEARIGAISRIVTTAISVVVGLVLANILGVLGVALGLAAGEIIGMGLLYFQATAKWTGITSPHLARSLLSYCLAGLLPMIGIGLLLPESTEIEAVQSLIIRSILLIPAAGAAKGG